MKSAKLTRRHAITSLAAASSSAFTTRSFSADASTLGRLETNVPVRTITSGPKHHWFGYYDKREFDPSDKLVLSNQVSFEGRSPTIDDSIAVGYVDTADGDRWQELGQSNAWGWQQGCMLQWVGNDGKRVLWNDRDGDQFVCRIHDLTTRTTRTIDRPIYTISDDGSFGLSADFRRIDNLRPGYGYDGLSDPFVEQHAPEESGVWKVDLRTGESKLVLSLAQVAEMPWHDGQRHSDAWHYFNHLLVNPSGTRFIVLHRYRPRFDPKTLKYDGGFVTRMLTANIDGTEVYELDPSGKTSHFIWKNDEVATMWTRPIGMGDGFYDLTDQTQQIVAVGPSEMTVNGHNTYLRGDYGDWILNDTYPNKHDRRQTVFLYHTPSKRRFDLGHFPSPRDYAGEWRCDTHPRSSNDGTLVAIDSPHRGGRQVHVMDIRDLLQQHS